MSWGWLNPLIDRGVQDGAEKAIREYDWGGAVRRVLADPKYKWLRFVKAMQGRMMDVDPSLTDQAAFRVAMRVYGDFLQDEGIAFGDPGYDWSRSGAHDLIQAMEIDHWERPA